MTYGQDGGNVVSRLICSHRAHQGIILIDIDDRHHGVGDDAPGLISDPSGDGTGNFLRCGDDTD